MLPPLHTADLPQAERTGRLRAGSTEASWRGRGLLPGGEQYPIRRENPGQRPETNTRGHQVGGAVLRASNGKPDGKTPCNVSTPSPAQEAPRQHRATPQPRMSPNTTPPEPSEQEVHAA